MTSCRSSTQSVSRCLHFGCACPWNRSLKRESDGEQALDDVIVQVARDAVTVGQDAELAHLALGAGQLPSQSGLIGECGHHVELFVVEWLRADSPHRDKDAGDRVGGPKRQHERRAGHAVSPGTSSKLSNRPGMR